MWYKKRYKNKQIINARNKKAPYYRGLDDVNGGGTVLQMGGFGGSLKSF